MATAMPDIPAVVHDVLRSPGHPLDDALRRPMERRFGTDFSAVRLHAGAQAADSAHAVGARAYTVSNHIVLGAAPPLHCADGGRLLAHELAHVLQYRGTTAAPTRISDPGEAAEREAETLARQALSGTLGATARPRANVHGSLFRIPLPDPRPRGLPGARPRAAAPRTLPRAPIPARGPNPGDCLEPLCATARRQPPPANDGEAHARVDAWERGALDCIRHGAAASNASHAAEIVANEESEIPAAATRLRGALGSGPRRHRDFVGSIGENCTRKTQEVRAEFHYNVVFENPPGASAQWGYGSGDWNSVDLALSALPAEATWANPRLIRFGRSRCHPENLDASGQCAGSPTPGGGPSFIGGEADASTGQIDIFDAGLGSAPYSRSMSLGLPATQQTLRHEVGHIIDTQIPRAEREHFFTDILPWTDYSWAWLNSPAGRPDNWTALRNALRTELGFDEAQLDAWLGTLQTGAPVTIGGRRYVRTPYFLVSIDASRLPGGIEFEYARSSRAEYIAELYALAVSRPDFLHDALPQDQVAWLKRVVFRTPQTSAGWAAQLAVRDVPPGLLRRLSKVFTWEQAEPIIDEILASQSRGGGSRDA